MTITNYFYIIDTLHDDDYMYMAYYLAIFPRQQTKTKNNSEALMVRRASGAWGPAEQENTMHSS